MLKLQPKLIFLSHTIQSNGMDYLKVRNRWLNVVFGPPFLLFSDI